MMLTLFTPAYNRAHTLPRLFDSLLSQTCMEFEWLIIDDGSSDHTAQLMADFNEQGKFPIRYIYKENGGKHTAHNMALEEARGEWFLCIDSDDTLPPTAVEDILRAAKELPENTGIASYKEDFNGHLLGGPFPEGVRYEKMHRLGLFHAGGEFSYAFPTEFARKFPFPVFPGERFMGECVVYDRMDALGQMYLLPKVTMICEYPHDGSSSQFAKLVRSSPKGYCVYFMQRIDLMPTFFSRVVGAGKYWCFRWIAKEPTLKYSGTYRGLVTLCIPVGLVFRGYYKIVRGL